MSERFPSSSPEADGSVSRIGVVPHPSRDIDEPLNALQSWTDEHEVELVQVPVEGQDRRVAEEGDVEDCDLVVAIGGDGTALAAGRSAARAGKPLMGVACGSLGVLTTVEADSLKRALDSFTSGDWTALEVPALEISDDEDDGDTALAFNDVAILRRGQGQVTTSAEVDGVLYARFVGDGFVVSTPIGSSAYTLGAGGPLLAPRVTAFVLSPLAAHGGSQPPLVIAHDSELKLDMVPGYGGIRFEVDGRTLDRQPESLTIRLRPSIVKVVGFGDDEPFLTGLRRRRIIADSPRIVAREERESDED